MALPIGIQRSNFLSATVSNDGVLHAVALKGGFQSHASISERNAIPLLVNSNAVTYAGFTTSDDPYSSGRRRVGMMVYVLSVDKFYILKPVGFFGNGGSLGETEWLALPEYERAVRIDPTGTYTITAASPGNGFTPQLANAASVGIAADVNSCWVETTFAGNAGNNDTITENSTTTATTGDTGIFLTSASTETDNTKVYVNGHLIRDTSYSWKKDGVLVTAETLEQGTELVWDDVDAGFSLDTTDKIQIVYETLIPGSNNNEISGAVTGHLIPDANEAYDLGNANYKFRDIYMSGNTIYMGGQPLSIVNGALTLNGSPVTGSVETHENHRIFSQYNLGFSEITLPNEPINDGFGNEISGNRFYRVNSSYLTLNPGDEVFDTYLPNVVNPSTGYDFNKSYVNFVSYFTYTSGSNAWDKDTVMLSHNTGETLKYKTGSLSGFWSVTNRSDFNLGANELEITTGSRIFVVGWENLDPTWPSTDLTQLPILSSNYTQQVQDAPDYTVTVDQHVRCKLLDAYTINSDIIAQNHHKIQSDFIGQPNTNLDNYVAISVFSYNPYTGNYSNNLAGGSLLSDVSFTITRT